MLIKKLVSVWQLLILRKFSGTFVDPATDSFALVKQDIISFLNCLDTKSLDSLNYESIIKNIFDGLPTELNTPKNKRKCLLLLTIHLMINTNFNDKEIKLTVS